MFAIGPASQPRGEPSRDRPAAVLEGQAIGWPEVAPLLAEASGAVVLEEVVLGRMLEQACRDHSIAVGEHELRAERELLGGMLARAAQVPVSESERLIKDVRVARGLGDLRFKGLLTRNAMLRALVRKAAGPNGIEIPPEDIRQAFRLKYGPWIRSRLILVRTRAEVDDVQRRLGAGESFADVATRVSADPSRYRGGLLDPISPADPNYPVAFRRVLEEPRRGEISDPVSVTWDNQPGYAIVKVEEQVPARDIEPDSVAADLEGEVRAVRERALMDRLARTLIDAGAAKLSVMDNELEWSWRTRRAESR